MNDGPCTKTPDFPATSSSARRTIEARRAGARRTVSIPDAVFLAALVCGGVAAFKGNRTAWALLAGAAFTAGITLAEVPFNPVLWMRIDLATAFVILLLNVKTTARDWIVIALFVPAWCLYAIQPVWISDATTLIVAAQFFLTFPAQLARWTLGRAKGTLRYRQEWTNLDPEVVAP